MNTPKVRIILTVAVLAIAGQLFAAETFDVAPDGNAAESTWVMRYNKPAENTMHGWEKYSLPLGNGHFGVNVFGGVTEERLQFTDKSLWADRGYDSWKRRCLTSFADIMLISNLDMGGPKAITASASNPKEVPKNLLDNNPGTKWFTEVGRGPHWIRIVLHDAQAQALPEYSFTSANDSPDRDPLNWKVKASNDGKNWTVIDARSGIDFPRRHQKMSFKTSSKDIYKHFLFELENNKGATCQLADIGGFVGIGESKAVEDYERTLDLNEAVAGVSYRVGKIKYQREMFASYPDRVFVLRETASEKGSVNFTVKAKLPFLSSSRTGKVEVSENRILFKGEMKTFGLLYEGQCEVVATGGHVRTLPDGIEIKNADEVSLIVSIGTNYKMESSVFSNENYGQKLKGFPHPHEELTKVLDAACKKTWPQLRDVHRKDYRELFSRVALKLDESQAQEKVPTDVLMEQYKKTPQNPYLEALYFHYGRYLLIASSRLGCLPANLQGTWNAHQFAPWTGGYWANINLQMNYWPAFNTNLRETYGPFMDFFEAGLEARSRMAVELVKKHNPKALADDCGMMAGTGNSPYHCGGIGNTSGFGTGPFIIQNMWEYYAFTQDKDILKRIWPFLRASSLFTSKVVQNIPGYGELLLCTPSYSPENHLKSPQPGSTYDQSLIYEGHLLTIKAAALLGISDDPLIDEIKRQLPLLDPIQIGASGQIKEFRKETVYGEFGHEKNHRHISQLVGLFPGGLINNTTPEWLAAARVSLNMRGDKSTGWAMAHRLNTWARIQDGERTYKLLNTLLSRGTMPNLWDTHPPFQIDGNFGGTAGIAEMLIQSHSGYIQLLPACPKAWSSGHFSGLCARGGFEVTARWTDEEVSEVKIHSLAGKPCRVKLPEPAMWQISTSGQSVKKAVNEGVIEFKTMEGAIYVLSKP
ncbi:glycoside hydrolase N-terminal domain-containing protein [Lentisphaera marina]|uniref:glycosyl hydrolase family 95 catalytic domain-containing protein n=1 Tax=Lentisphaera marina TaxID=1111041 RepID=UPI002366F0E5|nr:glycoside hydrolase N-terminal domain-containing protein [Lentisphaera marina]MDD7986199.1 glycoside hydrolase N-terminal domain-containing protein [Lentisphaera marina]